MAIELSYCDGDWPGYPQLRVTHIDGAVRTHIMLDTSDAQSALDKLSAWLEGRCDNPSEWMSERVPKLISDAMKESFEPQQYHGLSASTVAGTYPPYDASHFQATTQPRRH